MTHGTRRIDVLGQQMAYTEQGEGDPIVLLHGNPTSSHLWREVIPHLAPLGRCIAPDLIGMGNSDKLPDSGPDRYRFGEHRRYLDAFLDSVGVDRDVTLVVHDWGSALGFDWARRHPTSVRGIAYMEAIVAPLSWSQWPSEAREVFEGMRSDAGEEMVLTDNVFVERILPASVLTPLDDATMDVYREPYVEPGESRRPTLTWPREIPLDGHPSDVHEIVATYADWLTTADVPTLFVDADPGMILTGPARDVARSWPNQHEVRVRGSHFVQEDSGEDIGRAIAEWLRGL